MNYFNNGFQNPYQPIQPAVIPQTNQQVQPTAVPSNQFNNGGNFFYVNSKNDVDNWIVNQGQTVYLFDTNNSIFYIKSVAKNGSPLPLETYEYHKKEEIAEQETEVIEYVTKEEFDEMKSKFQAEIKRLKPLSKTRKETSKND